MPLQNRVTPFSDIERSTARGLFIGNRGCLHGDSKDLQSTGWRTKAWIVCTLEYKGLRRALMTPRRWTELFFLDEAVALAAGHRPCAFCRRTEFRRFLEATGCRNAPELDRSLHAERVGRIRQGLKTMARPGALPSGSFISIDGKAFLKHAEHWLEWTHAGYSQQPLDCALPDSVELLTPQTTVEALEQGYAPVLHPSVRTTATSPRE